jgi:phosphomethylpyrimidine synthase
MATSSNGWPARAKSAHFCTTRASIYCSMNDSQEVRELARLQNQGAEEFVAAEEADAGMAEMSRVYDETGRELYMWAGDRERD